MAKHLSRIGIMPLLLTIMVTFILAQPLKNLINFDISGQKPIRVRVIPSRDVPGGLNFRVQSGSISTHVIGTVRDGELTIVEGDHTAMTRFVLVASLDDGKYVRVITRWRRDSGGYSTRLVEFLRLNDSPYMELKRTPIELDISSKDNGQFIGVVPERRNEPVGAPAGRQTSQEEPPIVTYFIKPQFWSTYSIGVVRYGHHIVEERVDGLFERRVRWWANENNPAVVITSKYDNGREVTIKHMFITDHGFKMVDYKKRSIFV